MATGPPLVEHDPLRSFLRGVETLQGSSGLAEAAIRMAYPWGWPAGEELGSKMKATFEGHRTFLVVAFTDEECEFNAFVRTEHDWWRVQICRHGRVFLYSVSLVRIDHVLDVIQSDCEIYPERTPGWYISEAIRTISPQLETLVPIGVTV